MRCFTSGDLLGVVPGERQGWMICLCVCRPLPSSSFQMSDWDHLRCRHPVCLCKCLHLDHLRCRHPVCLCKCLHLDHLRWRHPICSCKCLHLDHLRCRHPICSCKCLHLDHLRCRHPVCSCKCLHLDRFRCRHPFCLCKCLHLDRFRCRHPICSCKCLHLDHLRCRHPFCLCKCLRLDHLRCSHPICSCKCLQLDHLRCRHPICSRVCVWVTFRPETWSVHILGAVVLSVTGLIYVTPVSFFVIGPSVHVYRCKIIVTSSQVQALSCLAFRSCWRSGNFAVPGTYCLSSASLLQWTCFIARKAVVVVSDI